MGEVILDIVLLLVISGALRRFLGGLMQGLRGPSAQERPAPRAVGSVHMERDPVCGTFVVPERAVSLAEASGRMYFCSAACRDRYRANPPAHPHPPSARDEYARGRTA